ncbi:MAG: hypothetical protein BMS9Abin05_2175 [Rhodothermia bacterium]|nr:MAG: hypothetical protein BMS9Abin05_2175 [Rhodothermia bacterium]
MPQLPAEIDQQELASERQDNLGSLLSRASEMFGFEVLAEFKARDLGPIKENHLDLLLSMDLEGIRISHLAERSGLSKQTVGPLVREMTKRGIVALKPDPTDGRAKLVVLTKNGIKMLLAYVGITRDITQRYVETVGQRRMTQLHSTLKKLVEEFEEIAS